MLLRGQNILGYRHYADDVVDKFVERAAVNGMDVFRIFDAMNDVRNLETAIKATLKVDKHAQGTISYTDSPVHTVEGFVDMAKQMEVTKSYLSSIANGLEPSKVMKMAIAYFFGVSVNKLFGGE